MENFEVDANRGQYRTTNHDYRLAFTKATRVTQQDMSEIPNHVYNFTAFDDILNVTASPGYLIGYYNLAFIQYLILNYSNRQSVINFNFLLQDVIGEITEIVQWDLDSKLKKVIFILECHINCCILMLCENNIHVKLFVENVSVSVRIVLTCTSWDTFAQRLKSYLDSHEIGPILMLLHLDHVHYAYFILLRVD